jgi:hypothetical protein
MLKGLVHEIFDRCFFLSKNYILTPDTRVKAVSNMDLNSPRYSVMLVAKFSF